MTTLCFSAVHSNLQSFFALDKLDHNGQVEWDEWLQDFNSKQRQPLDKNDRTYQEELAAAKAAWTEAAQSNPEKLNIDEFWDFLHPELSHHLILKEAELLLIFLDSNLDQKLSKEEYLAPNYKAQEIREKTFYACDHDGDEYLTREELFSSLNPRGEVWAREAAQRILVVSDMDGDNLISGAEFDLAKFTVLTPEKYFTKVQSEEAQESVVMPW